MGYFDLVYPLTRTFPWRWIGPLSYAGAFIVIAFLGVINAVLVGYETVTVFQNDFRVTQDLWHHKYMPYRAAKPGTLCSPHLYNVGDTFTTTNEVFAWTIQSIRTANAGSFGLSYEGDALRDCDVQGIYMTGDLRISSIEFSVMVNCTQGSKFDATATTTFKMTSLPGTLAPLLGITRQLADEDNRKNKLSVVLDRLIRTASEDLGDRISTAYVNSKGTRPVLFSIVANTHTPCPASSTDPACSQPPKFDIVGAAQIDSTGALNQESSVILDDVLTAPLLNLIQAVYAAVRIDLGIDSANNFILHKDVMPKTLNATFPVTAVTPANKDNVGIQAHLYSAWLDPSKPDSQQNYTFLLDLLPIEVGGPATLRVVYLCQFQQRKTPGSLFISVLVATLSMFTSGWAVYILLLGVFLRKHPDSNVCEGHIINSAYPPSGHYLPKGSP
ncbi:hypothetical protein D9619_004187 [Psilocybe cf. subviscida]|uniref:Transmembrane protein n=1 Tax=Psilocybe cf. subviscida TaxID=2480587 RepID=A0A8H5BQQ8_9AGAR|nr:hypothetical protein D9619_004187 [Psilocybe cf. subviscida]